VAWDSTWLALMPTVFVDGALAEAQSGAGSPQTALSFGAGCRFLVPRFVGTGLRVDAAWALGPIPFGTGTTPSVSVGVYQFF